MKQTLLALFTLTCFTGCTPLLKATAYEHPTGYEEINATYTAGRKGVVLRKYPKIFNPIFKNIRVGDTIFVHGQINHEWYVVRNKGKKYYAPYRDIYPFSILDVAVRPAPDSSLQQFPPIPLLAE
ncbi:hypothetical protein HUW51_22115 [Adhaeribacter swui]|uniref:SH3 domain-containing protein n=1 Tax=Adhaeribacter swui TaxID=2086471 RepID=A0A7G7GDP7_9BACT|nr:hypothetical protein [Adhaeribacter swui]QNF35281.1 hypothetical protein HUW51_22115 [Adhaeribacter swui]